MGRDAGALLAKARTDDPIDATVVLVSRSGDRILTSDPDDIGRLASGSGKEASYRALLSRTRVNRLRMPEAKGLHACQGSVTSP